MTKTVKFISILCVAMIIISITLFIKSKSDTVIVYNISAISEDLKLNDLTLITFKDKYYIDKNFSIEKLRSKDSIRDISLGIYSGKDRLFDIAFQFDHLDSIIVHKSILNDSIRISPDMTLNLKFKYIVNGKEKECYLPIILKKFIKHTL